LGAPAGLRPLILGLLKGYREASWNSARILSETENLVQVYSSGEYLESNEVINMEINSLPGIIKLFVIFFLAERYYKINYLKKKTISGKYFNIFFLIPGYDILEGKDLPGQFDYPCQESRSAVNCIRSVYSLQEAADICSADPKCRAFVIGRARTWTGKAGFYLRVELMNSFA
jgi:hypothetical protein